jgi:hypothetical protein
MDEERTRRSSLARRRAAGPSTHRSETSRWPRSKGTLSTLRVDESPRVDVDSAPARLACDECGELAALDDLEIVGVKRRCGSCRRELERSAERPYR